jgi:hypothetical protein
VARRDRRHYLYCWRHRLHNPRLAQRRPHARRLASTASRDVHSSAGEHPVVIDERRAGRGKQARHRPVTHSEASSPQRQVSTRLPLVARSGHGFHVDNPSGGCRKRTGARASGRPRRRPLSTSDGSGRVLALRRHFASAAAGVSVAARRGEQPCGRQMMAWLRLSGSNSGGERVRRGRHGCFARRAAV